MIQARAMMFTTTLFLLSCTQIHSLDSSGASQGETLALELHIQENQPIVTIRAVNRSGRPVAFSETFGFGGYDWLSLQIEAADGRVVPFPVEADLFEKPKHECLKPGSDLERTVDLRSWFPVAGGREWTDVGPFSYDLAPGPYRIRATYRESSTGPFRCRSMKTVIRSPWIRFTVN